MLEASLIATENPEVTRLDIQVLHDRPGDLFELLLGAEGRVEGIPDLLEDTDTADTFHADHRSGTPHSQRAKAPLCHEL
jgi:hypothetical protein